MGDFDVTPGLDGIVAARYGVPVVDRLKRSVERAAKRAAPGVKVWITARDERVRHSHAATDSQAVPANLRFILPKSGHDDLGAGRDLAREPRDPDLPIGNRINCRCQTVPIPDLIARTIEAGPTIVAGTRAMARVSGHFPRIVESEYPERPDTGGHWMGGAADEVAARVKGARAAGT